MRMNEDVGAKTWKQMGIIKLSLAATTKGGVLGWSERYGFVVVHCNNKQVKVLG